MRGRVTSWRLKAERRTANDPWTLETQSGFGRVDLRRSPASIPSLPGALAQVPPAILGQPPPAALPPDDALERVRWR